MKPKATYWRWSIVAMLFLATAINYLDRQVLSLTWEDFIRPEFGWTNNNYGTITGVFSLVYAIALLFAGSFVDKLDTKKGYIWSIAIWSAGAMLHALCGIGTNAICEAFDMVGKITLVSMTLFLLARCVLAIGEAGNFPAANKAVAEYFPSKDRAFATSVFNAGSTIGALAAPFCIPVLAAKYGWEMAFIIIGALGFIWLGLWIFVYDKPEKSKFVGEEELAYIRQDETAASAAKEAASEKVGGEKVGLWECFKLKQTWAFIVGKGLTDGVWWFFLFWMPSYLKNVYGMRSTEPRFQIAIAVLYLIVMLSLAGGYLPTYFVEKKKMKPFNGKMRAMLIFAFLPLVALAAQPLAHISYWLPVCLVGIAAAAHQSWSANIFSTVGDMFPAGSIATVTGIGGMAGGLGSFFIQKGAGLLFDASEAGAWTVLGAHGIQAGYIIMFSYCAIAYLLAWCIMKALLSRKKA